MAESNSATSPALDTQIESGNFEEKEKRPVDQAPANAKAEDDDDEDIDALIEDLESQDGHADDDEEEERNVHGGRVVPEDMLQTDTRIGLTEQEVIARRRKYGLNQMAEEKENLILKFLGYFVGPIQFVMEVSEHWHHPRISMRRALQTCFASLCSFSSSGQLRQLYAASEFRHLNSRQTHGNAIHQLRCVSSARAWKHQQIDQIEEHFY